MDYVGLLKNYGLKATPQRISVLKFLGKHTHPTIDELYNNIRIENPSISLATVYKNLNTLKDEGLVVEVNSPNQKTKYDIYEHPHIHVVCEKCGNIEDISFEDSALHDYQARLETKLQKEIKRLNVVVNILSCKLCDK